MGDPGPASQILFVPPRVLDVDDLRLLLCPRSFGPLILPRIHPMLKQLSKETLNSEILNSLYIIVQYCLMREYMKANDKYL